eukprot:6128228-Prymnesium_polylepis.1
MRREQVGLVLAGRPKHRLRADASHVDAACRVGEDSLLNDFLVGAPVGHANDYVAVTAREKLHRHVAADPLPLTMRVGLVRVVESIIATDWPAHKCKAMPPVESIDGARHRLDLQMRRRVATRPPYARAAWEVL